MKLNILILITIGIFLNSFANEQQSTKQKIELVSLRSNDSDLLLAQTEEAPNEPPFNTTQQNIESEAVAEELDPVVERPQRHVPRWKQQVRKYPTPERAQELNQERGLYKITKKNEFLYDVKQSPQKHAFSFRYGAIVLDQLQNDVSGYTFSDIYGEATSGGLFIDWEWQFFKSAGKLGLKVGSGFVFSQGNGKFAAGTYNDLQGLEPLEQYTFYLMPNSVSAIYRADFFNNQILVPFAEIGGDYYTFIETRDDGAKTGYGGAAAWHVAGGVSLLLDWISPQNMFALDREQGINSIYLTGEYRIVTGLSDKFDFTDNIISGGFLIEY